MVKMSPVANKEETGSRDEVDEGFHCPSISRCGEVEENGERVAAGGHTNTVTNNNIPNHHNKDSTSQESTKPAENSDKSNPEATPPSKKETETESKKDKEKEEAAEKARSLATFIVSTLTGQRSGETKDVTEATLLRCVRSMMEKHEILFKGQMKRLGITRETGYLSFVGVVNELFEIDGEGKVVITWGRIVALYAFGGQIAMYCHEKDMQDFVGTIADFLGQYAAEVITPFVVKSGGWAGLSKEFPAEDDLENKAWKFLTWTAIGLGLAATASFFTSH